MSLFIDFKDGTPPVNNRTCPRLFSVILITSLALALVAFVMALSSGSRGESRTMRELPLFISIPERYRNIRTDGPVHWRRQTVFSPYVVYGKVNRVLLFDAISRPFVEQSKHDYVSMTWRFSKEQKYFGCACRFVSGSTSWR
jgi:hypothetical protein